MLWQKPQRDSARDFAFHRDGKMCCRDVAGLTDGVGAMRVRTTFALTSGPKLKITKFARPRMCPGEYTSIRVNRRV